MKFNVQRVLTPAYLTSVALVVLGVVFGLVWSTVAAWLFVLLGLALNAMAVSVTEIHDAPRAPRTAARRSSLLGRRSSAEQTAEELVEDPDDAGTDRVVEPEAETAATPVVPAAGSSAFPSRR